MEIKLIGKDNSSSSVSHNIISTIKTIDSVVKPVDLDMIHSTLAVFLQNCGLAMTYQRSFLIKLADTLEDIDIDKEDQECTPEDCEECEECEFTDECEYKVLVIKTASLKESTIETKPINYNDIKHYKGTKTLTRGDKEQSIRELMSDPNYIAKFKDNINNNETILKLVLKTYLTAVFNNTAEKID